MRKAMLCLSALFLTGGIPLSGLAETPTLLERIIMGKPSTGTTGKKTTVSKKSKDPVNIPVSSGRFRPSTEANNMDVYCFYWQHSIVLSVSHDQGEVRVLLKTPDNGEGRLYRLGARSKFIFPVSGINGDYSVEVATSTGQRYIYSFELTD